MPKSTKKSRKGGAKAKHVEVEEEVLVTPEPEIPARDVSEEEEEEAEGELGEQEMEEVDETRMKRLKMAQLTANTEQRLVDFYEENPLFYDKSLPEFKNAMKKERLINKKASELNISREY